jgi:hypothetical protein
LCGTRNIFGPVRPAAARSSCFFRMSAILVRDAAFQLFQLTQWY